VYDSTAQSRRGLLRLAAAASAPVVAAAALCLGCAARPDAPSRTPGAASQQTPAPQATVGDPPADFSISLTVLRAAVPGETAPVTRFAMGPDWVLRAAVLPAPAGAAPDLGTPPPPVLRLTREQARRVYALAAASLPAGEGSAPRAMAAPPRVRGQTSIALEVIADGRRRARAESFNALDAGEAPPASALAELLGELARIPRRTP
jgi:hypothetical protein